MEELDFEFWKDCPLVGHDPEMVSGAPVVRDAQGRLTRMPANTLIENVEAYMELQGMTEDEAVEATLESFPSTVGGAQTIRTLLAYAEVPLSQLQP